MIDMPGGPHYSQSRNCGMPIASPLRHSNFHPYRALALALPHNMHDGEEETCLSTFFTPTNRLPLHT